MHHSVSHFVALLLGFSATALATPLTWNVNAAADITLPSGSVVRTPVLGSFTYDSDTGTASAWSIVAVLTGPSDRGPTPCEPFVFPQVCDTFSTFDNTYVFRHIAPMSSGNSTITFVT